MVSVDISSFPSVCKKPTRLMSVKSWGRGGVREPLITEGALSVNKDKYFSLTPEVTSAVGDILALFMKEYKNVAIAGGFVREVLLKNTDKIGDVDIYIQGNALPNVVEDVREFVVKNICDSDKTKYRIDFNEYQTSHGGYFEYEGVLFNVIIIRQPIAEYINDTFDLGICECWLTLDNGVPVMHTTSRFDTDKENKTITLYVKPTLTNVEGAIINHMRRVHQKYPDYNTTIVWV